MPTSNPGKDNDCPYRDAQFNFWEAQGLSQLTCQVQILARTLTVLTDVCAPLLNHPVEACPYKKKLNTAEMTGCASQT